MLFFTSLLLSKINISQSKFHAPDSMLKFRYYEKATKFETISTFFCYLATSKQVGRFFQTFVAFSEHLNFKSMSFSTVQEMHIYPGHLSVKFTIVKFHKKENSSINIKTNTKCILEKTN